MKPNNTIYGLLALLVALVISAGYAEAKSYRHDKSSATAEATTGQIRHRHHHHRRHHRHHHRHHRN